MQRIRTISAAGALLVGLLPAAAGAQGGQPALAQAISSVQIQPSADGRGPALAFATVGRTTVSAPVGAVVPAGEVVGPTAYLEPAAVDGLVAAAPYFAWATVTNDHPALRLRAGYAGRGYSYGYVADRTVARPGDQEELFALHKGSYPWFPPRSGVGSDPGGVLSWEPVTPLRDLVQTRTVDEAGGARSTLSQAGGFAANLRVDAGDLVAATDVVSPRLTVPTGVAGQELCLSIGLFQNAIPGVVVDVTFGGTLEGGQHVLWFEATVRAGSVWPRSGDPARSAGDEPAGLPWATGGTWKLRINIVWSCSAYALQPGARRADVRGPASAAAVADALADEGIHLRIDERAVAGVRHAILGLGAGPRQVTVEGHGPGRRPRGATPGRKGTIAAGGTAPPAGEVGACVAHGSHVSAGVGHLLPAGHVRFQAGAGGLVDGWCVGGRPVARFGLPVVEVDGVLHDASFPAGLQIWEEPYALGERYRVVYRVTGVGRAGPVAFAAGYLVIVEDGLALMLAILEDHHTLDGSEHRVRFPWYADPEAGDGERFLLAGHAPVEVEAVVPAALDPAPSTDALLGGAQTLRLLSHQVAAAGGPMTHYLQPQTALTQMVVHDARRSPREAAALTAGDLLPPSSLAGRSVALLLPQEEEGAVGGGSAAAFIHRIHLPRS